jgi:hypothetical protein
MATILVTGCDSGLGVDERVGMATRQWPLP